MPTPLKSARQERSEVFPETVACCAINDGHLDGGAAHLLMDLREPPQVHGRTVAFRRSTP
jgi:hypothetical protein